ncbi:MAG TPA: potassium-transporting ATPase subunit C [Chthoniobacteraceae bacterium]|nr:potassium-transporting ATPase subunit C [Chthoniobacteraceae bacterium]
MKDILIDIKNTVIATILLGIICCGIYPVVVWAIGQALFHHQANGSLITAKDGTILGSELIGQPFSSDKYFNSRTSSAGTGYDASNSSGSNFGPTSKKLVDGDTKQTAVEQTGTDGKTVKIAAGPDVVDYDGIKLRLLNYCEQNGIAYDLLQGGKPADPKAFKDDKGNYDQVKLINAFNDDSNPLTIKSHVLIPADAITSSASGLDPHISPANAELQLARVAKARNVDPDKVRELVEKYTDKPFLGLIGDPGVNVLKLNLALDDQYPAK